MELLKDTIFRSWKEGEKDFEGWEEVKENSFEGLKEVKETEVEDTRMKRVWKD